MLVTARLHNCCYWLYKNLSVLTGQARDTVGSGCFNCVDLDVSGRSGPQAPIEEERRGPCFVADFLNVMAGTTMIVVVLAVDEKISWYTEV